MCLSHLLLEDTLERLKDMLYKTTIIPHSSPPASKIIKNYSKFPKTATNDFGSYHKGPKTQKKF
jgi:hypothetical protein